MRPILRRPSLRNFHVNRDLAILLLIVVTCAIPFLNQPFHMDDGFYMDMARNALQKPLFPNDTPYVFEGRQLPDMGSHSHPPLQTYFLALIQALAGEGPGTEWIYHLTALVFPILAVMAFYFLASRFLERPIWPSLLLACCPLFMVMQHNLMTDVPTLAFWLAAICCFLWASDLQSHRLFAASSIFQFAAMFTSYQSAALIPLLGFYHFRKRGRLAGWMSMLAALSAMALWLAVNSAHYRRFLLFDTFGYIQSRRFHALEVLGTKLVAILQYQGWLVVFPLFLIFVFGRGLKGRLAGLVCLLAAYLAQMVIPDYRISDKLIFVLGFCGGLVVLFRMVLFLKESMASRKANQGFDPDDAQFIGLWYMGVMAFCLFLLTEGSARYLLPLVPPFLIYYFRHLEVIETREYRMAGRAHLGAAMVASGSLVISLAFGFVLSHADLEFARIYPQAARECSRIIGSMPGYYGGEWGFRYYLQQAGVRQLPVDDISVTGGNWLIRPKLALPYEVSAALNFMTVPTHTLSYSPTTPVRLLDLHSPAGFYSTGWGLIPFSLSRSNLEVLELRQVNFLVERLPWAHVETTAQHFPWPGYVEIQGRSPLALLIKSASRVQFPWRFNTDLDLQVLCGVSSEPDTAAPAYAYEFCIRQRSRMGEILSELRKSVRPGAHQENRAWQPVRLRLVSLDKGAEYLELDFQSSPAGSGATGAFAEALLHPVRD